MKDIELFRDSFQEEIWKDIPGFEDKYQASTFGRIRSKDSYGLVRSGFVALHRGIIIKSRKQNSVYLVVWLRSNGKTFEKTVHRLVALTFIPNELKYKDVNHKNGNKSDNRLRNLEWCSRSYNIKYSYRQLQQRRLPNYKVMCNETGELFDTIKDAERKYSLKGGIQSVLTGRNKTAGGMTWRKI